MISVTDALKFVKENPSDDPKKTRNVREASLVLSDRQVGATAVVGTVVQRLTRLTKEIEKLVAEKKKRERGFGGSPSRSGGGGGGGGGRGLGIDDVVGGLFAWKMAKGLARGGARLLMRGASASAWKTAGPVAAVVGGMGVYSGARSKSKQVSLASAATLGGGIGVVGGPLGILVGAATAVGVSMLYNGKDGMARMWSNTVSITTKAVDRTLKWGTARWQSITQGLKNATTIAGQYIQDTWETVKKTATTYKNQVAAWLEQQGTNLSEWLSSVTDSLRKALTATSLRSTAMEWIERLKKWMMEAIGLGGGSGSGSGSGSAGGRGNPHIGAGDMSRYGGGGSPSMPADLSQIHLQGAYTGQDWNTSMNPGQGSGMGSGAAQFGFGPGGYDENNARQYFQQHVNPTTGTLMPGFGPSSGGPAFVQHGGSLPVDRRSLPGFGISGGDGGQFRLDPRVHGTGSYGGINAQYDRGWDVPGEGGHMSARQHYEYLKSLGATDKEALMLTGAAASESSFNPHAVHDGGVGYGLYGHNMRDRIDMRGMSWQQQASAALKEMRTMPRVTEALANARSASDLAVAQTHFERPRGYSSGSPTDSDNFDGRAGTISRFSSAIGAANRDAGGPRTGAQNSYSGGQQSADFLHSAQMSRPYRYGGTVRIGDQEFHYVTGGAGRGSSTYGDHNITRFTTGEQRAAEGRSWRSNAFEIEDYFDPKVGDRRTGVLMHPSKGYGTQGCFGINQDEWPAFERALQGHMQENGGKVMLRVNPDGTAVIIPQSAPSGAGASGPSHTGDFTPRPNASSATGALGFTDTSSARDPLAAEHAAGLQNVSGYVDSVAGKDTTRDIEYATRNAKIDTSGMPASANIEDRRGEGLWDVIKGAARDKAVQFGFMSDTAPAPAASLQSNPETPATPTTPPEGAVSPSSLAESGRSPPSASEAKPDEGAPGAGAASTDASSSVKNKRINMDDIPVQNPDVNLIVVSSSDNV